MAVICGALIALAMGTSNVWAAEQEAEPQTPLTEAGQKLEARYADQLDQLRTELTVKLPQADPIRAEYRDEFLASAEVVLGELQRYKRTQVAALSHD